MVEVINIYGVLGLYAGISFAGVAVITFIVPETKGKNLISPQSVWCGMGLKIVCDNWIPE